MIPEDSHGYQVPPTETSQAFVRPGPEVSARFSHFRRRDTLPELHLRKELFGRGMRYRVTYPVPGAPRRTIDIAFPGVRVAILVDGCFWHGCPEHYTAPARNGDWWARKSARNRERDAETNSFLEAAGWCVIRVWEHEDMTRAADKVCRIVAARAATSRGSR